MSARKFWDGIHSCRDRERHKILMPTCPFRLLGLKALRYLIDGLAYKSSLTNCRATGIAHIIIYLLTVMAQCGAVATRPAPDSRHETSRWNEKVSSNLALDWQDHGRESHTGYATTVETAMICDHMQKSNRSQQSGNALLYAKGWPRGYQSFRSLPAIWMIRSRETPRE